MESPGDSRGILYPERLPTFHREAAAAEISGLARWFWIPRWNLAPEETSLQEILPFPASNLVVEPHAVTCSGPTTQVSNRELRGIGWAVGALLRPAAIGSLGLDPRAMRNATEAFEAAGLHGAVSSAMKETDEELGRARAVAAYGRWMLENVAPPDEQGLLANAMEEFIAADRTVVRVEQVAQHLGISARAVQRLARSHVGLPPAAMIRRYRLQEAAQRLRTDPSVSIAQVAAELGYADHAHLSADFRSVLGFSPSSYRHAP